MICVVVLLLLELDKNNDRTIVVVIFVRLGGGRSFITLLVQRIVLFFGCSFKSIERELEEECHLLQHAPHVTR